MFLDTSTKSLELVLGSAVTTNAMPVTVDYVDLTSTTTTAGASDSQSNGVTAVTILAAPAASTVRKVNGLTVYNADTAAKVVTIRLNNNTTLRPLVVVTLQVGDTLAYTDVEGWYCIDTNGQKKTIIGNTVSSLTSLGLIDISGAAAGQIKFPSTQNPSANVNTLDDYKEGTFTPTLTFGGGSVGMTLSTQSGQYTKIGNIVYIVISFRLTAKGTSTGQCAISGLPYTSTGVVADSSIVITASANNMAASVTSPPSAIIAVGTTFATPSFIVAGTLTVMDDTHFTNTSVFRLSGWYPA